MQAQEDANCVEAGSKSIVWKIAEFLIRCGYRLTTSGSSLLVKHTEDKVDTVLVYIDDLFLTGDLTEEIQQIKSNLSI